HPRCVCVLLLGVSLFPLSVWFSPAYGHLRALQAFPTRRSSDLSFLDGQTGRLFREFGFTLAIAVLLSSVVALSMGPMVASRLLKDRKSTRLNSSHVKTAYAVFCLKKKTHYQRAAYHAVIYGDLG